MLGVRVFPVGLLLQADGAKGVVADAHLGGAGVAGGHRVEVILLAGLKGVAGRRSDLFHIIGGVGLQIDKLNGFLAGNRLQHLAALILRLIPKLKLRGLHGFAGNGTVCLGIDLDHLHRLDLGVLNDDILAFLLRSNLVRLYGIGSVNGIGIVEIAAGGIQLLQVIVPHRQQAGQRRAVGIGGHFAHFCGSGAVGVDPELHPAQLGLVGGVLLHNLQLSVGSGVQKLGFRRVQVGGIVELGGFLTGFNGHRHHHAGFKAVGLIGGSHAGFLEPVIAGVQIGHGNQAVCPGSHRFQGRAGAVGFRVAGLVPVKLKGHAGQRVLLAQDIPRLGQLQGALLLVLNHNGVGRGILVIQGVIYAVNLIVPAGNPVGLDDKLDGRRVQRISGLDAGLHQLVLAFRQEPGNRVILGGIRGDGHGVPLGIIPIGSVVLLLLHLKGSGQLFAVVALVGADLLNLHLAPGGLVGDRRLFIGAVDGPGSVSIRPGRKLLVLTLELILAVGGNVYGIVGSRIRVKVHVLRRFGLLEHIPAGLQQAADSNARGGVAGARGDGGHRIQNLSVGARRRLAVIVGVGRINVECYLIEGIGLSGDFQGLFHRDHAVRQVFQPEDRVGLRLSIACHLVQVPLIPVLLRIDLMDIQVMDIVIDADNLQGIIGCAGLEVREMQNASVLAFRRLEHIVFFQHGFRQLAVHQLFGEEVLVFVQRGLGLLGVSLCFEQSDPRAFQSVAALVDFPALYRHGPVVFNDLRSDNFSVVRLGHHDGAGPLLADLIEIILVVGRRLGLPQIIGAGIQQPGQCAAGHGAGYCIRQGAGGNLLRDDLQPQLLAVDFDLLGSRILVIHNLVQGKLRAGQILVAILLVYLDQLDPGLVGNVVPGDYQILIRGQGHLIYIAGHLNRSGPVSGNGVHGIILRHGLLNPIIARRKIAGVFGLGGAGHGGHRLSVGIFRGILRVNRKGHVRLAQGQAAAVAYLPQLELIDSDSPHGNVLDRLIEISLVGLARRNGKRKGRAVQHVLAGYALLDKLVVSRRQPAGGHGAVRSGGQNQRVLTIGIIGIGAVGLLLLYLKGGLQSRIGIQRAYLFNLDFTRIKDIGKGDPYGGGIAADPRAGGYSHQLGGGIQSVAIRGLGLLHPISSGFQFPGGQNTAGTGGA